MIKSDCCFCNILIPKRINWTNITFLLKTCVFLKNVYAVTTFCLFSFRSSSVVQLLFCGFIHSCVDITKGQKKQGIGLFFPFYFFIFLIIHLYINLITVLWHHVNRLVHVIAAFLACLKNSKFSHYLYSIKCLCKAN